MNWIALSVFSSVFYCLTLVVSENLYSGRSNRRFKRVVYGIELTSQDQLHTQYMVSLKQVFGCESSFQLEEGTECDAYAHRCGGALIAPDFVVTACHCLIYEIYQVEGVELPPFHPDFDKFTSTTTTDSYAGDVQSVVVRMQPLHPIFNTLSLWMGSVENDNMPQRQFAKKFFLHSECSMREVTVLAKNESEQQTLFNVRRPKDLYDVGLVRTWIPFTINKDVKLIPMKLGDEMMEFHRRVLREMSVCLYTGFGATETDSDSERLRYVYRHAQCSTRCSYKAEDVLICEICTTSIARPDKGLGISRAGHGDSGSPMVCDYEGTNTLFGVASAEALSPDVVKVNATNVIFTAVACFKELLTTEHINYLRDLDTQSSKEIKMDEIPLGPFDQNTRELFA